MSRRLDNFQNNFTKLSEEAYNEGLSKRGIFLKGKKICINQTIIYRMNQTTARWDDCEIHFKTAFLYPN